MLLHYAVQVLRYFNSVLHLPGPASADRGQAASTAPVYTSITRHFLSLCDQWGVGGKQWGTAGYDSIAVYCIANYHIVLLAIALMGLQQLA